jgi:hypothetical protein
MGACEACVPRHFLLPTVLAVLLCACATPDHAKDEGRAAGAELTVPYRKAGAGFGNSPLSDVAVVPNGQHPAHMAALSLQRAMTPFNVQLISPDITTLKASDNDLRWTSDIGPLLAQHLTRYHSVLTRPPLRNRLFGVRFSGRLVIVDNELRYSIESRLFGRGAGEVWRELDAKDYDGSHFAGELSAALRLQLRETPGTP